MSVNRDLREKVANILQEQDNVIEMMGGDYDYLKDADEIISMILDKAIEAVKNEHNQTAGSRSHAIKAIESLKEKE